MAPLTREQRVALARVYLRDLTVAPTYRAFRRTVERPAYDTCVMVRSGGIWLGIERDGYTHS